MCNGRSASGTQARAKRCASKHEASGCLEGTTRDNHTVVFAVSDSEVSFQEFGRLFRDELKCRNALFLEAGVFRASTYRQ